MPQRVPKFVTTFRCWRQCAERWRFLNLSISWRSDDVIKVQSRRVSTLWHKRPPLIYPVTDWVASWANFSSFLHHRSYSLTDFRFRIGLSLWIRSPRFNSAQTCSRAVYLRYLIPKVILQSTFREIFLMELSRAILPLHFWWVTTWHTSVKLTFPGD